MTNQSQRLPWLTSRRLMWGVVVLALVLTAVSVLSMVASDPAHAHTCSAGHYIPDTPARSAVDLNGDGDTDDLGEAAVVARDGRCVDGNIVTEQLNTAAIAWTAIAIAVFVAIVTFGFNMRLVAMAVRKGFAKLSSLVMKG